MDLCESPTESKTARPVINEIANSTSSIGSIKVNRDRYDQNVRILASLVPDEIIYRNLESPNIVSDSSYNGVLLFVDVSGFTDLCEKYNQLGKGGPSRITQVLNSYIGAMVQEIMSHNGDILKFSGDAFLALWKCNEDVSMSDVVHAAIDCALGIQRSHGTYKSEVGIILRVKIVLAAGPAVIIIIGGSNFMILGSTVFEIKKLGNVCGPGEIIISPSIKMFLSPNEYILENIVNTNNFKILSIGSEWTPSTISNQFELFDAFALTESKKADIDDEDSEIVVLDDDDDKPTYYSYMLRPSLDYAATKKLDNYLRNFIISPVVRAIDLNEPLDYLTEMRQVVIVFINVVTKTQEMRKLAVLCSTTYRIVCDQVSIGGGCVNKTSMFDKDLMFLVIFGLRGFKHTLEAQKALYCSKEIIVQLRKVDYVASASIGVCTGITYCGVVGHPMRKEYTVIGRTVNKAARLMVAYPYMISCDRQTFLHSQLQARYFTLQPYKSLKGFKNPGPIYKFCEDTIEQEVIVTEMRKTKQFPLLDRHREMEMFLYFLMTKQFGSDIVHLTRYVPILNIEGDYNMMIVKGQERQGKTRLLYEIAYYVNNSVEHIACSFSAGDSDNTYKIFRDIFGNKCSLDEPDIKKRTKKVLQFLQPFKVPEFLCALNKIFHVSFKETVYYLRLTDEQKLYVKNKMIKYLCIKAFKKKCIITIDNIENMDDKSWGLFKVLLNTELVFVCATMGHYSKFGSQAKLLLDRPDINTIKLGPVNKLYHAALICQFLNVMAVSLELERYIQVHSRGNPGWIESFLTTLSHSEGLQIIEMDKQRAANSGFVIPPFDMLVRHSEQTLKTSSVMLPSLANCSFVEQFDVEVEDWEIYHQAIMEIGRSFHKKTPDKISVCVLPSNICLEDMETEDVLDVLMIKTYDSLQVQEQLLLKCSAVLGDSFSRKMLEYVIQSQNIRKNAEAIQKLFEIGVFSCARGKYTNGDIQIDHYRTDPNINSEIVCYCTGFPANPLTNDLPKYANCGYIRFREPTFREMLCNLLTDSQANLYHVRAMWFLESQTRRCLSCGLGYFTTLIGQSNDDDEAQRTDVLKKIKSLNFALNKFIDRFECVF